ncbi:MAG: hypothetical protein M3O31_00955 [Acidobacteriota bacterium]|nr:hypothetical protein [Acidobacteriota bacterium]
MVRRGAIGLGLLLLVVSSLLMIAVAVRRYPELWLQHGSLVYVLEPVCALVIYAVAFVWIARTHGPWWDVVLRNALPIGLIAALVDVTGLTFESGLFRSPTGAALQISVMLTTFLLWGFAGWRAARALQSSWAGVLASVISAGVCATIAVTAGFVIEFFIAPPSPAYVVLWGEYQRSGWTDARAFGLANTLDSGFSHLTLSLIVAAVFGVIASMIGRMMSRTSEQGKLA